MLKFTIIVPVFNAAKYLEECVNSILRQTYSNFEILLVDDGSTDESGGLCDKISECDSRVIVLHRENGGTSAARNEGIFHSTGDYITFIDNDDFWISDSCLDHVAKHLESSSADVLMHINGTYYSDADLLQLPKAPSIQAKTQGMDASQTIQCAVENELMTRAVWNKVVRASLIKEESIFFPDGMRNEDTDWTASILELAQCIVWHDESYYAYRKGHESAQTSKPLKKEYVEDLAKIILKHIARLNQPSFDSARRDACFQYLAYPYVVWIGQASIVGMLNSSNALAARMRDCAFLLQYDLDPTVHKVNMAYRLLGLKPTGKILGVALKKKYPNII